MLRAVRINATEVAHETIDGETIMIHLGSGKYFSIDGAGSQVWQWLSDGITGDELLAKADAHYVAAPQELESDLGRLVDVMMLEGLVVEEAQEGPPAKREAPAPSPARGDKVPFAMPDLEVYTDMQEFMLVDPLHDADEAAGWPNARID